MGKSRGELPEAVGRVRTEIETWRRIRKKRSPMPVRLWNAATELAQQHGVYRISQALRLSYESLRSKVKSSGRDAATARPPSSGFVEIGGVGLIPSVASSSVEVEMFKPDGSRMAIRVSGCSDVDVASMLEGFWGRSN